MVIVTASELHGQGFVIKYNIHNIVSVDLCKRLACRRGALVIAAASGTEDPSSIPA
jgi:hypothetical protein